MSNAAPPARLSLNQLRLVLVALSHRTGVHPCDANPKLALATINAVLALLEPKPPTCRADACLSSSCAG